MRKRHSHNRYREGFTALELMIAIVIFGLLCVMAFPYWGQILTSYRQNTATGILLSDLRLARFEAVKRNEPVRVRVIGSSRYVLEREAGDSWVALRPTVDFSDRYWTQGVSISGGFNPALFLASGQAEQAITYSVYCGNDNSNQVLVSRTGMVRSTTGGGGMGGREQ
jgi:prepilin-type N-terminal cleavage/methylation domain-containing protein